MATKTIILRPTGGEKGSSTCYPDTLEVWETINEEIADDDATYCIAPKKSNTTTLTFTIPDKYKNLTPSSIKFHHRTKCSKGTDDGTSVFLLSYNNGADNAYISAGQTPLISTYQDYVIEISQDILDTLYSILLGIDNPSFHIYLTSGYSNDKNVGSAQITQVYLELTYEVEDDTSSESMFIRQNGSWVELSGAIYSKQNGVWTLTDSSILQNETHYILNDTTT